MANVEKFTTPITNRNVVQPVKEQKSPEAEKVDFQNTSKVKQTLADSELLKQNNGIIENQKGAATYMNLLKNPDVTIGFIRNIYMMMDIVALLPLQSKAFTEEIQQLFGQLNILPEDIADEMINQENASTAFKGELFDFLRDILGKSSSEDMKNAVISVLKAVNSEKSKGDILFALSGSFSYLSEEMKPFGELSARLAEFAEKLRFHNSEIDYKQIKDEALSLLENIEKSILFSEKLSRIISMTRYNLSRYNNNPDLVTDSANKLMTMMNEDDKSLFLQLLYNHLSVYENHDLSSSLSESSVMNIITEILKMQSENDEIKAFQSDSVENIIHSMLSSPSNFTPLLHYIIPVEYGDIAAFAEMWIDPDEEDADPDTGIASKAIHMLIVFDIDNIGKIEAELCVKDLHISLSLRCLEEFTEYIKETVSDLKHCADFSDYKITDVAVSKSEHPSSLINVFRGLSSKRTGINVKI